MHIPKIIHQLWIGNKPPPIKFMNSWKEKHPNFEYIFWNENELIKRILKI
jgi:mannosyltransferase OCH1-like enzyme